MTQITVVAVAVQIGIGAARRGAEVCIILLFYNYYYIIILLYYNNISRWSRNVVDFYDIISIIVIMRAHNNISITQLGRRRHAEWNLRHGSELRRCTPPRRAHNNNNITQYYCFRDRVYGCSGTCCTGGGVYLYIPTIIYHPTYTSISTHIYTTRIIIII